MGIIIRQSMKGTLVTYIGAFIGFLTTFFIVTKYLDPEIFGLSQALRAAALMLSALALLGTNVSMVRFFPHFKTDDGKNNGFFFYVLTIPFIGFVLATAAILLFKEPILSYFSQNSALLVDYFYWLIPLTFFFLYWTVFETYSSVLYRIAVPSFIREIVFRVLLIAVYLLYAFHVIDLTGFVLSFTLVYSITMGCTFFYVSRISHLSISGNRSVVSRSLKKEFFTFSGVLILGSVGATAINSIDIFMISGELGLADAGIYSIAFFMIAIVEIPSRSITSISTPIASCAMKVGNMEEVGRLYKKVSLHQLLIGGIIFILIWINVDNIYKIIPNGSVYADGKWVIFFLGIARLIQVTLGFGNNLISYSKYFRWTLYFTLFIAALTVFTNSLLIPRFGIAGAAMAVLISCSISYSLQQWVVQMKLKLNPFSIGILKTVGIVLLLLGINFLLPQFNNPFIDLIFRSVVIGILSILLICLLHLSEEVDWIFKSFLQKIKKTK
jgi:Membrane protein involved in the export of O-antigen and teichoic acid